MPRSAVVVEAAYGTVLAHDHVRTAVIADGLAEAQVALPRVPIVFAETRKLAQEWTYRFLAAAVVASASDGFGADAVAGLAPRLPLEPLARREPTASEIRKWATAHGHDLSAKGRIPAQIRAAWEAAQSAPTTLPPREH